MTRHKQMSKNKILPHDDEEPDSDEEDQEAEDYFEGERLILLFYD